MLFYTFAFYKLFAISIIGKDQKNEKRKRKFVLSLKVAPVGLEESKINLFFLLKLVAKKREKKRELNESNQSKLKNE